MNSVTVAMPAKVISSVPTTWTVIAPPAIALAIGAYLNVQFPSIDAKAIALGAYVVFIGLNWVGVGIAAT